MSKKNPKLIILTFLKDGNWHQYKDIVNGTNLSSRTVSKYFKEFTGIFVEKILDQESGNYPYPVKYRITEKGIAEYTKLSRSTPEPDISKTWSTGEIEYSSHIRLVDDISEENKKQIKNKLEKFLIKMNKEFQEEFTLYKHEMTSSAFNVNIRPQKEDDENDGFS